MSDLQQEAMMTNSVTPMPKAPAVRAESAKGMVVSNPVCCPEDKYLPRDEIDASQEHYL